MVSDEKIVLLLFVLRLRIVFFDGDSTNQAALIERALEVLPSIAAAIAEPLSKTEKMVFVGSGSGGGGPAAFAREFEKIAAELPETIPALSGFDLKKALSNLTGQ